MVAVSGHKTAFMAVISISGRFGVSNSASMEVIQ
jgi:hypothetical protein